MKNIKHYEKGWESLPEPSKIMYKSRYFRPNEDYEGWLERVTLYGADDEAHKERLKTYLRARWFHTSTPISSNAGLPKKGNPVACFVQSVGDSKEGIIKAWSEGFWLGSMGGGIGRDWSAVRGAGAKVGENGISSGTIPFLKVDESLTLAVSQGGDRRAQEAAYLHISHPDIQEFISLRDPSGDDKRRAPQLFNGVNLDDEFMRKIVNREQYELRCPKTRKTVAEVGAKETFDKIIKMREFRGTPFILFGDTINRYAPEEYKAKGMEVSTSNLCTEITLHTNPNYTAVCVLLSYNLEFWDEWGTDDEIRRQFAEDIHRYLDNIIDRFIENNIDTSTEKGKAFANAVRSASYERSIGIGAMGYHYLLQKKRIPFDSVAAMGLTKHIFKTMKEEFNRTNKLLADEKGACPLSKEVGTHKRNIHITAIAPTASISTLTGLTSPGIDPILANTYSHKTNIGTFNIRNRYLEEALEELGLNTEDIWKKIQAQLGSVQGIEEIPEEIQEVFKTAYEIKQEAIIELAAVRTPYIDQAQSTNLFIKPPTDGQYLYDLHLLAWAKGLKSLYYIRGGSATKVGQLEISGNAKDMVAKISSTTDATTPQEVSSCIWCE